MKRILIYFSFFIFHFSFSQSWLPVGTAIQDTGASGNSITSLHAFNGELYASGEYYRQCPTNNIARWNGIKWDSLTSGTNSIAVLSLLAYDSLLFVGGQYTIAGGYAAQGIAQWDGTKWDTVGSGLDGGGGVYALCIYNGKLYAGGQYNTTKYGRVLNGIAKWNGSYWDSLGPGLNGFVWSMAVYNGKLYVGGYFTTAGGISANSIAVWDGTKWDTVGSGVGNFNVNALAVYNNKLYVGGDFPTAGGITVNNIATWDGTKWDSVSAGMSGSNHQVRSLLVYNGNLYAGGYFTKVAGKPANEIAKWDGTNWSSVGMGLTASGLGDYGVLGLGVYDSSLYAGGDFTKSGATTVMGIASWRDSVLLGENEVKANITSAKLFPNPNTGIFTIALNILNDKAEISIYNMLGEQVYQSSLSSQNTQINLSNKPDGIYFYRVICEDGSFIGGGKFIIAK